MTFVRSTSCDMIGNNEHNANSFLGIVRQFVDEFSDAFEIEGVGCRDGYLEKDCDIFEDANSVDGFCG